LRVSGPRTISFVFPVTDDGVLSDKETGRCTRWQQIATSL